MRSQGIIAGLCVVFVLAACGPRNSGSKPQNWKLKGQIAKSSDSCATAIPAGFDWPADPTRLYQISGGIHTPAQNIGGKIDTAAQRSHAWSLFNGVTQQASAGLPVFMTWYTVEETFDETAGRIDCASRHTVLALSLPTQLVMSVSNPIKAALNKAGIATSPRFDPDPRQVMVRSRSADFDVAHDGVVAFSHVAFNQEMYDYIRNNKYYSHDTLNSLLDVNAARVPIQDPPIRGISLKLSWWPAAPDRLTAMPVWKDDPRFPGDAKNPPATWKDVVVVDPIGGQAAPASIRLGGFDHPNPSVVSISKFFHVQVTQEEADLANADFRIKSAATAVLGRPLHAGDYLLLTAMHIATREFDPWVFATLWWSDDPNAGPRGADRPQNIKNEWSNYILDVSYNINAPKETNGEAPVAYNPWLELFQPGGTRSQCMACHARAAFGPGVVASFNPAHMATKDPNGYEATPMSASDSVFAKNTLSLHRIWTIQTRAK